MSGSGKSPVDYLCCVRDKHSGNRSITQNGCNEIIENAFQSRSILLPLRHLKVDERSPKSSTFIHCGRWSCIVQNYCRTELSSRQQQSKQSSLFYLLNSFHCKELVYLIVDVFKCLQFPSRDVFDRPEDGVA